jgi:hypothetical protein
VSYEIRGGPDVPGWDGGEVRGESWREAIAGTLGPAGAPCNCGCQGEPGGSSGYPEILEREPGEGQPGRVLLGLMMGQRNADPLTQYEEARAAAVAERPVEERGARHTPGCEHLFRTGTGRNLAGSAARAALRDTEARRETGFQYWTVRHHYGEQR